MRTVTSLGDRILIVAGFHSVRQWCKRQENTVFLTVKTVKHWIKLSRIVMGSSSQASLK